MKEKLRKAIKDTLDIGNVVVGWVHGMKWNNVNNKNYDWNRTPPTVVAKLLHFKDKTGYLAWSKITQNQIFQPQL